MHTQNSTLTIFNTSELYENKLTLHAAVHIEKIIFLNIF